MCAHGPFEVGQNVRVTSPGIAWLVSGAPGSGKSTVGRIVAELAEAAVLDKDTLFSPLVDQMLLMRGLPLGQRESDWYTQTVKPLEYQCLFATAKEVLSCGTDVVVTAPFTSYVRDDYMWGDLCHALGGGEVRVLWVQSDDDTTYDRMRKRMYPRDKSALSDWRTYCERVRASEPPTVDHAAIDNRPDSLEDLPERVAAVLKKWA